MSNAPVAPPSAVFDLIENYASVQVIHVAVQLGLADLLGSGPRSIDDLADATTTHTPSLARLLRMLAGLGLVAAEADGRIGLTPAGRLLRADVPGSLRDRVLFLVGAWFWRSWGDLLYSVQTGKPAFDHNFGMSNFDYWERQPGAGAIHDAAFSEMARSTTAPLVAAYDWARFRTIADIGGNHGPLLAAILAANPGVRGILFDLPHVVAGAATTFAVAGVADRCTTVGGDFFTAVPAGGDAYLLAQILHDWDDARCAALLRQCHQAMALGTTLLVIEQILPEELEAGSAAVVAARVDLMMLVLAPGGRERTVSEFRGLLSEAGFTLQQVLPTGTPFRLLEATTA